LNQIVSGAGFQPGFPLSLGALFAASGSSLADARVAAQPPLPPQIGQTRLLVAGQPVPLIFAGPTSAASSQVNGVLPFELRVNLVQQVAAQNGTRRSQYLEVPIALAQPSIFAVAPGVSTQALAIDATGPGLIADTANPALRGGSLVIYAEGLGPVNQALPPGAPAPADPPARPVAPVSVTIGGQAAAVENAQLMPGSAGVYQIRVTVPDGVDAGDAVPVVITAGGLSSAVLTIAVR
jgi:uncharacterized protein (TIGR03437 family)